MMRPSQLSLPYGEFEEFVKGATLSAEDHKWLGAWHQYDLACSPMDDDFRKIIRIGHYVGWCSGRVREEVK